MCSIIVRRFKEKFHAKSRAADTQILGYESWIEFLLETATSLQYIPRLKLSPIMARACQVKSD
jgi:hypothetical protein